MQFALVSSIEDTSASASRVRLRAAPGHTISYQPGQVARIRQSDGVETYYAFASGPDGLPEFEFLVGKNSPYGDQIFREASAERIAIDSPMGNAFPLDRMVGRSVVLMGIGTAIAPLRSALQTMMLHPKRYPRIRVLYGVRQFEDICFPEEWDSWRKAGVEVVFASSGEVGEGMVQGYVQRHVTEWVDNPLETCALICGHPTMVGDCTGVLTELGVPSGQVHTNY